MSRSPDDQPTTVLPRQTVEQPAVTTAPASRRSRVWSHVPARIGRARTSTVVIGCLFVLLLGLYTAIKPAQEYTTFTDPTSGATYRVPLEDVSPAPTPTPTPASTTTPRTSTAPRTTPPATSRSSTAAPSTDDSDTTAPETTEAEPSTAAPTTSSAAPTTRAPSTTAGRTSASATG